MDNSSISKLLRSLKTKEYIPGGSSFGTELIHSFPSNMISKVGGIWVGGIEVLVGSGNGVGGGSVGGKGVEVGEGCVVAQAATSTRTINRNSIFFIGLPFIRIKYPTSAEVGHDDKWYGFPL